MKRKSTSYWKYIAKQPDSFTLLCLPRLPSHVYRKRTELSPDSPVLIILRGSL
jgi:hypothetical protein